MNTEKKYFDERLQAVAVEEFRNNLDFIAERLAQKLDISSKGVRVQLQSGGLTAYEASEITRGAVPIDYFGAEIYVRNPLPK